MTVFTVYDAITKMLGKNPIRRYELGSGTSGLSTVRETSGVSFQLAMSLSPASWKLTPRRHRTVISQTVLSALTSEKTDKP